jgi:MFS family permease
MALGTGSGHAGAWIGLGMLLSGTGAGLINSQMTNVAVSLAPSERSGMASGISGTMRQAGFVFGIALHTLVVEIAGQRAAAPTDALQLSAGLQSAFGLAALAALVGCVVSWALLRSDAVRVEIRRRRS